MMNLDRSLLFSWLEEDNIQRAYFRVRPLLSPSGDARTEAAQLWPDEGCLRIVPDRNEQHTFKVRMRTLGAYCLVDLANQPADASKIRTNKNYRPDRGEVNQYILYSDTVHPLPEHSFYQLIDGKLDELAQACEQAITPRFYLRQDDTLYGPIRKDVPGTPEPAKEAAATLFELPCPDGVTRTILCMNDAPTMEDTEPEMVVIQESGSEDVQEASVPADAAAEPVPAAEPEKVIEESEKAKAAEAVSVQEGESLPIGKKLNILDHDKGFEETLQSLDKPVSKGANLLRGQERKAAPTPAPVKTGPLSGTPLVRTPLKTSVQQPKNRVQEIVSSQWTIGKYEPPAQNLPDGTTMRKVENPVEDACASLRNAWNSVEARTQLVECMLSLEGIHAVLDPKLCRDDGVTVMQRVLRDRLQDLEAERLTALCELDKAHRDLDAYKTELVNGLTARIQRETSALEATRAAHAQYVETLTAEVNALTAQRDALASKVDSLQNDVLPATVAKLVADAHMLAPTAGIPLRMAPVVGEQVDENGLIARLTDVCTAAGLTISRNEAIALLTLMAICPRIGLSCTTPAPLATLAKNIAAAFGWQNSYAHQISPEQKPMVAMRPADGTPALLMTSLPNYAPVSGVSKLLLAHGASNLVRNAAYDACQWPVYMLPALPFVPDVEVAEDVKPVCADSLATMLRKNAASDEEISAVLAPVLNAAAPLAGEARKEMFRFVSACAGTMEGGLAVAVDWAILLWIVPALERNGRYTAAVKSVLDEYPLSLAKLS